MRRGAGRAALAIVLALTGVAAAQERAVPPSGRTLTIIGQDRDAVSAYVDATGMAPGGVMVYTSLQLQGLEAPADYGAGVQDAAGLLAAYPGASLQIGLSLVGALDGVVHRESDAQIQRLIAWLRGVDRQVYLRIGYECDLPANEYEPLAYVAAWRRIAGRIREAGLPHVALVWHSYADWTRRLPADWYPGDDVVDWVAVSYFDPDQAPWLEAVASLAREHGKPLMIAEASPRVLGTRFGQKSWDYWFAPLFRFIETHDARALCYINWEWERFAMFQGQGWEDARLEMDPVVLGRWREQMRRPRFAGVTP